MTEAASAGTDTVRADVSWTLGANLENLTLTGTGAINGTGNTLANVLTGNAAANVLNGGTGADTMAGGLGDDTYRRRQRGRRRHRSAPARAPIWFSRRSPTR